MSKVKRVVLGENIHVFYSGFYDRDRDLLKIPGDLHGKHGRLVFEINEPERKRKGYDMKMHYCREGWGQIECNKNRCLLVRRTDRISRVTCKRCLSRRKRSAK